MFIGGGRRIGRKGYQNDQNRRLTMVVLFPFRYLDLRTERGHPIVVRDALATLFLAALMLLPFGLITEANLFHKDGFVDKVGAFSSVLTGFYVAGLLAVATFSTTLGDLDKKIAHGAIILRSKDHETKDHYLTRREYVCQMFGYLSALSLVISLLSIVIVVVVPTIGRPPYKAFGYIWDLDIIRLIAGIIYNTLVAHLVVTTSIGLYYFVDRLYTKQPTIKSKPPSAEQ